MYLRDILTSFDEVAVHFLILGNVLVFPAIVCNLKIIYFQFSSFLHLFSRDKQYLIPFCRGCLKNEHFSKWLFSVENFSPFL